MPALTYGLEVRTVFVKIEIKQIEMDHSKVSKRMIKLPITAASIGTTMETGTWPVDQKTNTTK